MCDVIAATLRASCSVSSGYEPRCRPHALTAKAGATSEASSDFPYPDPDWDGALATWRKSNCDRSTTPSQPCNTPASRLGRKPGSEPPQVDFLATPGDAEVDEPPLYIDFPPTSALSFIARTSHHHRRPSTSPLGQEPCSGLS